MNILENIFKAQDGQLVQILADDLGLSSHAVKAALRPLVREISAKIQHKADNDVEDYDLLMEVVDDEEQVNYLSKPDWIISDDGRQDGGDILAHLYGDEQSAFTSLGQLDGIDELDETSLQGLGVYAATLCVAAMADRGQKLGLFGDDDQEDRQSSGWLATIIAALLTGLMQGLTRRRRRRRRTYSRRRSTRTRRRTRSRRRRSTSRRRTRKSSSRRRRKKSPSVTDLIGDLFRD